MPAPEGNRSVLLDGLPTELLDSIEVSKVLPDQDADSIGGRIDFKTKRPTDLTGELIKIKIDTQYNEQAKSNDNPRFAITYGDKLSDTFGHVLALLIQVSRSLVITMKQGLDGKLIQKV